MRARIRASIPPHPPALLALLSVLALACTPALSHAQASWSGNASWLSDYRFRGQPLSDGKATPQLNINLDSAAGWYLGGFASGVTVGERDGAQILGYAGYAWRGGDGWSWDGGCTQTVYTRLRNADYLECYGGASAGNVSMRLYYAPHYLGRDARTLYGEITLLYPLHPRISLLAHAGLLHTLSGTAAPGIPERNRYDARLGLSFSAGDWSAQLVRTISESDALRYSRYEQRSAQAWVASIGYAF